MNAGADRILADRVRRLEARPPLGSLTAAALAHLSVLALVLLLPRLAPPPKPLEFVPVTIVPAAALGVRRPLPPAPAPETAKAEPKREPPAPPPVPVKSEAPVLPTKPEKQPEKRPEPAPKPTPTSDPKKPTLATPPAKPAAGPTSTSAKPLPPQPPQAQPGTEVGRKGSPTGSPLGSSSFGSEIAGLDNPDFTYGYYIDRLLSAIDDNWHRPPVGDRVRAIVSFRIQRDGSITELRVSEPSGYNAFDLAALRAVQNAVPFPPLPRAYRHDSLGVNLIVR